MRVRVKPKGTTVVIETGEGEDGNATEIAIAVSNLTGVDVIIELVTDDNGFVVRIQVYVDDENEAEKIVKAITDLDKEGSCVYSLLCLAKDVHIVQESSEHFIAAASNNKLLYSVFIIFLLSCIVHG